MIEAYNNGLEYDFCIKFQERRDFLYERISKIKLLKCQKPKATFYMFVDISGTNMNSIEFANELLEEQHIAVVPGETYGKNYSNYIRIAFTKDICVLSEACNKIEKFINNCVYK